MAAADELSLGAGGGDSHSLTPWIVGGAVAIALHGAVLLYLNSAPAPAVFDNQAAIEIDMAPPPTPAGAEAPAESAQEAQPEELSEIAPDEAVPPEEMEVLETEETPLEELTETEPDVATAVEQVEAIETPPDVQAAVTLPPEETVTAREEEVTPPPAPKPVVKREEPKPKPKPAPKPVVKREEPKPVEREERPKPSPQAVRGDTARKAQAGSASPSAASAGRPGAASGNPAASASASAAYKGRLRGIINGQKRPSANISGLGTVSFTLNRSGRIVSISASGDGPAAAEAQAMVRRSSFPPFPPEMAGATATFRLPVRFSAGR